MNHRIVRVGNLEQFRSEIPINLEEPAPIVRLDLTEEWVKSQIPTKEIQLHLQGLNDLDEIVWLMESHRVTWFRDGPETPVDQSINHGMYRLFDLVFQYLSGLGYEVRSGTYGIPADIHPLKGVFGEVARWEKHDDEFVLIPNGGEMEAA